MSWPTKILLFRRPEHAVRLVVAEAAAAFPRFRKEAARVVTPARAPAAVVGFGVPPESAK
jgi:hypothetical protein